MESDTTKQTPVGLTSGEFNFIKAIDSQALTAQAISASKGFWKDGKTRNRPEMIALMHSELSEALEGIRKPEMVSEKLPGFSVEEEELADLVIRVFDYSGGFNLRLGEAIVRKMHYNSGRPLMHGKLF